MSQKQAGVRNSDSVAKNEADRLLQAHQSIIDAWFEVWMDDQRSRAEDLLRRRRMGDVLQNSHPAI